MRSAIFAALGLGLLGSGCNFLRFDDLSENTPILLLKQPDDLQAGFGVSLSTAEYEGQVHLLVGGEPNQSGGAVFDVANIESPVIDAIDTGFCEPGGDPCFLAMQTAGIGFARIPGGTAQGTNTTMCFIEGVGSTPTVGNGIVGRCQDNTEYPLEVPEGAATDIVNDVLGNATPHTMVIRSDKAKSASVIVGAGGDKVAWFYGPDSMTPVALVPEGSSVEDGYGTAVATAAIGKGRVLAVSAPEAGHVWLFKSADGKKADAIGCLQGPKGFGRAMATGPIDADTADDLVISDPLNVTVLSGDALFGMPATKSQDCSLASLPEHGVIASFGCGQTPSVSGCESSDFGAALEVADLDGDGDGEVIVGAPTMRVREEDRAGAILVYDMEGARTFDLTEVLFISSAESDDQLGSALATPRIGDRNIIAAGAPGGGKVAMFYCSALLPPDKRPARCN